MYGAVKCKRAYIYKRENSTTLAVPVQSLDKRGGGNADHIYFDTESLNINMLTITKSKKLEGIEMR